MSSTVCKLCTTVNCLDQVMKLKDRKPVFSVSAVDQDNIKKQDPVSEARKNSWMYNMTEEDLRLGDKNVSAEANGRDNQFKQTATEENTSV